MISQGVLGIPLGFATSLIQRKKCVLKIWGAGPLATPMACHTFKSPKIVVRNCLL